MCGWVFVRRLNISGERKRGTTSISFNSGTSDKRRNFVMTDEGQGREWAGTWKH